MLEISLQKGTLWEECIFFLQPMTVQRSGPIGSILSQPFFFFLSFQSEAVRLNNEGGALKVGEKTDGAGGGSEDAGHGG